MIQINRAEIEIARVKWLDELDAAKDELERASFEAAMPGGDEQAMIDAEVKVRGIERKLGGVKYGLAQADKQEREASEAARLIARRRDAVDTLAVIHQRFWATERLDNALRAAERAIEEIDRLGIQLKVTSSGWFGSDSAGQMDWTNFLTSVDAHHITDTVYQVRAAIGQPGSFANHLPVARVGALRALAKVMPEVEDVEVKAEALAAARKENGTEGEQP